MGSRSYVTRQSVVIPVRDEEGNIEPLVRRIHQALFGLGTTELIFVDDSDHDRGDMAVNRVRQALCGGECQHVVVRYVHRFGRDRHGGLSGAVTDGIAVAEGDVVVVMDGDLQHPPETIPAMLEQLVDNDIVVASRYTRGGASDGLSGPLRYVVSRGSTILAKLLFPVKLRGVSDPMTGFFVIRKQAVNPERLHPQGFKILVEILLANPRICRSEVPFEFAERVVGESKGTIRQGASFLAQLLRHRVSVRVRL